MLQKAFKHHQGFSLIELAVTIIILGIIAVIVLPKFIDLQQDAHVSNVKATGGAFAGGISLSHLLWAAKGGSGPVDNLQVYEGLGTAGQLDMNLWGYPAQSYPPFESSPRLNNTNDCMSVWRTVLQDAPNISTNASPDVSDHRATYISPDQCRYFYNALNSLSIYYNSQTGEVITDSDPS